MTTVLAVGETFTVQFVWQLESNDYIRALFTAEILELEPFMERYVVRLASFLGGRQEDWKGEKRPLEAHDTTYWPHIPQLVGSKLALAYEAADGRPLRLKLTTLTGEHTYFTRMADK
ncbi:MAG TPA: hypothetical protein VLL52_25350 [Anaerolineae bacterium]|nr:hypothetical protein [Anaerolineae bacterium]